MLIRIGYDISFELANPTPLITMLYVHPSRRKDLQAAEEVTVEPNVPVHTYQDSFGNICGRLLAPAGTVRFTLEDRKSTRLNSSHTVISYAVFCLKKKKKKKIIS